MKFHYVVLPLSFQFHYNLFNSLLCISFNPLNRKQLSLQLYELYYRNIRSPLGIKIFLTQLKLHSRETGNNFPFSPRWFTIIKYQFTAHVPSPFYVRHSTLKKDIPRAWSSGPAAERASREKNARRNLTRRPSREKEKGKTRKTKSCSLVGISGARYLRNSAGISVCSTGGKKKLRVGVREKESLKIAFCAISNFL